MAINCLSKVFSTAVKNSGYLHSIISCKLRNKYLDNLQRVFSTAVHAKDIKTDYNEILKTVKEGSSQDILDKKVFAIVHIGGKQFKIANNDVIMIHKKIEAECGDIIRLEKVLAIGGRNFTLIGQPLLKREIANIQGIVVEKTKGEKKIAFKKKRRKNYKRWKGHRQDLSVIKINSISFDMEQV